MSTEINSLVIFPTVVTKFNLGREVKESELNFLLSQETYSNIGNVISCETNILEKEELKEIFDFCNGSLNKHLQEIYHPDEEIYLQITQSWANYTKAGQFHHKHNHSNSFLSGVFYANCEEGSGNLFFYKSVYEQIVITPKVTTPVNCDAVAVEIASGDLLIFPSRLSHMVPSVASKTTRVSIAFNSFPKGIIGNKSNLNKLYL
jgi:uncharacterized protein (TIGR02466 family)